MNPSTRTIEMNDPKNIIRTILHMKVRQGSAKEKNVFHFAHGKSITFQIEYIPPAKTATN